MSYFSKEFIGWLDANAETLDKESGKISDQLLERIASEGVFKISVPKELGGEGRDKYEVIEFISELARHSLTAAFISWGHSTFIENILETENPYGRKNWLDDLISGKLSGGSGQSNAVKYLSKIEKLSVSITEKNGKLYLNGKLPWITNLRADNFAAVFVADYKEGNKPPAVITIPSEAENLIRSENLEFISLQGANTASLGTCHRRGARALSGPAGWAVRGLPATPSPRSVWAVVPPEN